MGIPWPSGEPLGYAAAAGIIAARALYRFLLRREQDRNWLRARASSVIRELIEQGTRVHDVDDGPAGDLRPASAEWREIVGRTLRGPPFRAGTDRFVLESAGDRRSGPLQRLCEILAAPDRWISFGPY